MVWMLLKEGGYISPFLSTWYSSTGLYIYWAFLAVSLLLYIFGLEIAVQGSYSPQNMSQHILRRMGSFLDVFIYLRAERRISWYVLALIPGLVYGYFLAQIQADPNILVINGTLQQLQASDVMRIINFLYRFLVLGVFLMAFTWAMALRAIPLKN
jgi:hypothetical protein